MKIRTLLTVLLLLWPLTPAEAQGTDQDSTAVRLERQMLGFLADLASPASADDPERRATLDDIHDRLQHLQRQSATAMRLLHSAGDTMFSQLPLPDRLRAVRDSAALLAAELLADAGVDEAEAARYGEEAFANRHRGASSSSRADALREAGFERRQVNVLGGLGLSDAEIAAYREALLAQPPERWGRSVVEWFEDMAQTRRAIAASLQQAVASSSVAGAQLRSSPLVVANPKDHSATLDLRLLRASVPPQWELSIVPADSLDSAGQPLRVQVAEAGTHYRVHLPAHGQARVMTIVTPLGVPAEQTTARWAVEGWIGDELLGGIVQEMPVPARGAAAAAVVPPISLEQPFGLDRRWLVAATGAGLLLLLLTVAMARRRRHPVGSPTPRDLS